MLKWLTCTKKRQVKNRPPSVPAGTVHSYDAARWQRVNQDQYLAEKLRNGISPAVVADLTALLAQLAAQQTLPSLVKSIVADVSGYERSIKWCRNDEWDGYYHTHQFLDDRQHPCMGQGITRRLNRTLRISPCAPVQPASGPAVNANSTHGDTISASASITASILSTSSTAASAHADATERQASKP